MDKVKAFFASKNISAHTFAVLVLTFITLYSTDPQVKAFVDPILAQYPSLARWFSAAVGIVAIYSNSTKKSGAN